MHRFINRCIILTFYVSSDIWSIIPNPQKYLGKAFQEHNITDIPVRMSRNYGHPFFNRDYPHFKEWDEKNPRIDEALFPDIFAD